MDEVIPPTGGCDDECGNKVGEDLRLLTPEHGHIINCCQAHYGPVSGGRATHGEKGVEEVVGEGVPGPGRDVDGILGWVTGR